MLRQISGFIIDVDGVLVSGDQRIPGAPEVLKFLSHHNYPFVLVTNTTRKSRTTIWHHLKRLGLVFPESRLLTAPLACVRWLKNKQARKIYLLTSGSVINDFKDFKITSSNPEYVVIGDLGRDLTFEKLDTAFRLIMQGAKILALQKNRFWRSGDELSLDAGAIVAALEFSTRRRALVLGKPRKEFFQQAIDLLNLPPSRVAVIGDDLIADIKGAQRAGLLGIAVKTGKYSGFSDLSKSIRPDIVIDSIAELPDYLLQHQGEADDRYNDPGN